MLTSHPAWQLLGCVAGHLTPTSSVSSVKWEYEKNISEVRPQRLNTIGFHYVGTEIRSVVSRECELQQGTDPRGL